MTFPCVRLEDLPLSLEDLIRGLAASGKMEHLHLVLNSEGQWQASRRRKGGSSYKVVTLDDPVDAIISAMAPDYGHPWTENLPEELHHLFPDEPTDATYEDPEDLI